MRLPSPSPRRLSGRKTRSMNNRPGDLRPVMPPSTSFVSGSEMTTASGRLSSMPDCWALKRRSPSPMAASTRASGASVTATRGSRRPSALMAQSLARRARCYTVAMPSTLTLPRADGTLARYTMTGQTPITGAPGPIRSPVGLAGTDDLQPGLRVTIADVEAAYEESCGFIESVGGRIILMASRALAACAKGPDDYLKMYGRILGQVKEPVIIHWLGDMFDPALAGYWGSHDLDRATETLLAIVNDYTAKIDGVKISLLDQKREIAMRRRFPGSVRMYTGDDFDYPTTIGGDADGYSDALLGIFDVIAPAASAALHALDGGDRAEFQRVLAPTLPLSRHVFGAPTRFYKTGVVFAAYLNGHQSHFRMVGGLESARSIPHLAEQFVLMDRAALLRDPEQAAERMRRVLAVAGVV